MSEIKVPIKSDLITISTTFDNDDKFEHVKLKIKISFIKEVEAWLNAHFEELPKIYVTRYDFEENFYYICLPTVEAKTQFELTWR